MSVYKGARACVCVFLYWKLKINSCLHLCIKLISLLFAVLKTVKIPLKQP